MRAGATRRAEEGGSDDDDSSRQSHFPKAELWSDDDEPPVRGWQEPAASEPRNAAGPRGGVPLRRLGGPRTDEPLSLALLGRLLGYVAAFSVCLTSCEVLTMWASRKVAWAVQPWFVFALAWTLARWACALALPYWCASHAQLHPTPAHTRSQPGERVRAATVAFRLEGACPAALPPPSLTLCYFLSLHYRRK